MKAEAAAVTPIMNVLVAAATRMGIPQNVFRKGTLMMPPPRPRRPEMAPATRGDRSATGSRFNR
jgi:hypothetical protein